MTPDVKTLYAELGITLTGRSGSDASARCFAAPAQHQHEDRRPSASVSLTTGAWICHACGARGGAYDAALLAGHTPRGAMDLLIRHGLAERRHHRGPPPRRPRPATPPRREAPPPPQAPTVTWTQIETWHRRLRAHPALLQRLHAERGISPQTIDRFLIGDDRTRITIPVTGADGALAGALRWRPFHRAHAPKMLALPGTRRQLFPPPESLSERELVICEGEPDALAAHSNGIAAVAIPGVTGWRPEWARRFHGRDVTIVLDCDWEGRSCAARIADDLRAAGIDATVLDLAPERADGHDLTDHLLDTHGRPRSPAPRR